MTTGQQLVDDVRDCTDTEGDTHVTDAQILKAINYGLSEVYELLVQSGEDWNVTTVANVTIAAGATSYSLPADFYQHLRLCKSQSGSSTANDWYRIPRIALSDEVDFNVACIQALGRNRIMGFVLEAGSIRIVPYTQAPGVYELKYYPAFVPVTLGATISLGPPGQQWEVYGALNACVKVARKKESDETGFLAERAALRERIVSACAARSASEAEPPPVMNEPFWARFPGYGR